MLCGDQPAHGTGSAVGARGTGTAVGATNTTSRYRPPVIGSPVVVNPFTAPTNRYAAGHRGVDLAAGADARVLAAGAGVVRFAGPVAGRGLVVVVHPDGVSTEYEPLRVVVRVGQAVSAGQLIGMVQGAHAGCPTSCLHWGARRSGDYFDPMSLLRPLGLVRLLPLPA